MSKIEFIPGKRYSYQQHPVRLLRPVDLHYYVGEYEATGVLVNWGGRVKQEIIGW